jgi:hypothetical protein
MLRARLQAAAHGVAVERGVCHVADAHRRVLARGHADHAMPQCDFRAHARGGVAPAGHGVQAPRRGVEHQHHGVFDAHGVAQAGQRALQQFVQAGACGQAFAALAQAVQQTRAAGRGRQALAVDGVDVLHGIDVGALETEHLGHAAVRGDARQPRLHALEQRPGGLRAQVAQVQAIETRCHRVEHQHRGMGVGQDVLARLVEELERQRHMALVHVDHLRDVGHVGRAVVGAGGHDGRDGPFQAGADGVTATGRSWRGGKGQCCLRAAPGVWSKAASGRELHGHHILQRRGQHGGRVFRPVAHLGQLVLHGREVAPQQRLVVGIGAAHACAWGP